MKPILLDLFCCAGGAGMGYSMAGFDVVGVDIKPQPHYPFPMVEFDAIWFMELLLEGKQFRFKKDGHIKILDINDISAFHASPPCQAWTVAGNVARAKGKKYPELIDPIRKLLKETNSPYIIENVMKSPLDATLMLCGTMFGLDVIRHRYFESSFMLMNPPFSCTHTKRVAKQGYAPKEGEYHCVTGHLSDIENAKKAMGIDWMVGKEIVEAIPPAYTEYIGGYLMKEVIGVINE